MITILALALTCLLSASVIGASGDDRVQDAERAQIEKLHERDIVATAPGDVDQLVSLFTEDGVLLSQGAAPIAGKAAILEQMKQQKAQSEAAGMRVVKYAPTIRQLTVKNGVAYEWGQFEVVQQTREGKTVEFHGNLLRVLERQPDGSWKFSRVMWNAGGP